jgi:hypothetical protein
MSLDPSKPTDQELVSTWPSWIRALHAYINVLEGNLSGSIFVVTELSITAGDTTLVVGTDLSRAMFEVVFVSGVGPSTLKHIYGGTQGQFKVFIFMNNLVSVEDGDKDDGEFYLNQLPVGSVFGAQENDVLMLANVDGNGSDEFGWWKEVYRQVAVK